MGVAVYNTNNEDLQSFYGYVYLIENSVNGKVYVGQTTQKPEKRKYDHFRGLNNNTHHNTHLQNSFNKHGGCSFSFNIVNWANNKDELDKLEQYYIEKYNSLNDGYGYNLKEGGG